MTDAQTSGGLLMAVDPDHVDKQVQALVAAGTLAQAIIGDDHSKRRLFGQRCSELSQPVLRRITAS